MYLSKIFKITDKILIKWFDDGQIHRISINFDGRNVTYSLLMAEVLSIKPGFNGMLAWKGGCISMAGENGKINLVQILCYGPDQSITNFSQNLSKFFKNGKYKEKDTVNNFFYMYIYFLILE